MQFVIVTDADEDCDEGFECEDVDELLAELDCKVDKHSNPEQMGLLGADAEDNGSDIYVWINDNRVLRWSTDREKAEDFFNRSDADSDEDDSTDTIDEDDDEEV